MHSPSRSARLVPVVDALALGDPAILSNRGCPGVGVVVGFAVVGKEAVEVAFRLRQLFLQLLGMEESSVLAQVNGVFPDQAGYRDDRHVPATVVLVDFDLVLDLDRHAGERAVEAEYVGREVQTAHCYLHSHPPWCMEIILI
jgi:hypothetical protein